MLQAWSHDFQWQKHRRSSRREAKGAEAFRGHRTSRILKLLSLSLLGGCLWSGGNSWSRVQKSHGPCIPETASASCLRWYQSVSYTFIHSFSGSKFGTPIKDRRGSVMELMPSQRKGQRRWRMMWKWSSDGGLLAHILQICILYMICKFVYICKNYAHISYICTYLGNLDKTRIGPGLPFHHCMQDLGPWSDSHWPRHSL